VSFTGAAGTLVGTLSPDGDTIGGSIDEGPYSGFEFFFTRSTFPFGHITLSGTCAGVPISLDTDLGRTNREVHNNETFRFDVLLGSGAPVGAGLAFDVEDVPLEAGTYTVIQWGDWDEEELPNPPIHATLWAIETTYEASGGTVTISSYVGTHIEGSFALEFQDGSTLSGTFNSNFGSSGTSYLEGTWQEDTFIPGNTNASSGSEYWSGTSFNLVVDFWDPDLSMQAWFTFPGYVTAGTYTKSPTIEEFWGHFSWEPVSGPQANGEIAATSSLNLDYYDGNSMSGSFDLSFMEGGSVHGEFEDLPIAEW
jgi:hypothetical protein